MSRDVIIKTKKEIPIISNPGENPSLTKSRTSSVIQNVGKTTGKYETMKYIWPKTIIFIL